MADWKKDVVVNQGGMWRCCIQSVVEHMKTLDEEPEDGTVFDCNYQSPGNKQLIYAGRTWMWNRELP